MKKKIITWSVLTIIVLLIIVILVDNKSTLEGKIVKDNVNEYTVTVDIARSEIIEHGIKYLGKAEAQHDVVLVSETQGKVVSVNCGNGDKVVKNRSLLKVDDAIMKANFQLAEAAYQKAEKDAERFEVLYKEKNISLGDLENVRLQLSSAEAQLAIAQKELSNTNITSPFSGIIVDRYVDIGSTLIPGMPVANIVDITKLKVKVEAAAEDVVGLKKGMKVNAASSLIKDKTFHGVITSISVKANAANNFTVEVELENDEQLLRAGLYMEVNFDVRSENKKLVISRKALIGSGKESKIFVVEKNKAVIKKIEVGEVYGELICVISGLKEGENVITGGRNNLEDGANVIIKSN